MSMTVWGTGSSVASSELNTNFGLTFGRLIGSTLVEQSTSSSTTFADLGTVTIAPSTVTDHIWALVYFGTYYFNSSGTHHYPQFNFQIDSTGTIGSTDYDLAPNTSGHSATGLTLYPFYYAPTADEKSAGFTFDVQGRVTTNQGATYPLKFLKMYIVGN